MGHKPARVADTASWLRKAKEDLQIARQLVKGSKALSGGAIFHCQQAAEKALKAFLPKATAVSQRTRSGGAQGFGRLGDDRIASSI
jgi:HEPN domain-containing protein